MKINLYFDNIERYASGQMTAAERQAFEAELARLKNNTPLPDAADDAKLPAELKRLRGILRAQLK